MTYINVRHTVTDYGKWRPFFDADDTRRRVAGSTGINQVYRDAKDPNTVTLVMEWDTEMNAQKFINDPALGIVMQKAGVIGKPEVTSIIKST
jgi:hypothetical protein